MGIFHRIVLNILTRILKGCTAMLGTLLLLHQKYFKFINLEDSDIVPAYTFWH